MAWQHQHFSISYVLTYNTSLVRPAAVDDFVICRIAPYGQVIALPSRRLVRPAADDDFVMCLNTPYGQVLVLANQFLVGPAADDDFLMC